MKLRLKLKHKIIIFCVILMLVITGIIVYLYYSKAYKIDKKRTSSDLVNICYYRFDDVEKKNISDYLDRRYFEDETYAGFISCDKNDDFYAKDVAACFISLFGIDGDAKEELERLIRVSNCNISEMSILDVVYYVSLCNNMNYEYDRDAVVNRLKKNYDDETKLLFMNNSQDSINTKLVITANCCETIPDLDKCFDLVTGVGKLYGEYEFVFDKSKSIYNCGAGLIYYMSTLGLVDDAVKAEVRDWYAGWKEFYSKYTIDSAYKQLNYNEFLRIAQIMGDDNVVNNNQELYDSMTKDDLDSVDDLKIVYNSICYIERADNKVINDYIIDRLKTELERNKYTYTDIDLTETFYGYILSEVVGYKVDKDKLNNYIKASYDSVKECDDVAKKANVLYCTTLLDGYVNGYEYSKNADFYQKQINSILKGIKYDDDLESGIVVTRRIVELISDMGVHDLNLKLSRSQVNRIKKYVKNALDKSDCHTITDTELYIIDDVLNLGMVDDNIVINAYNKSLEEESCGLYEAYRYNICLLLSGDLKKISDKSFVLQKYEIEPGVYGINNEKYGISFQSICYGNYLHKSINAGEN